MEIERKFLLTSLPFDIATGQAFAELEQSYLSFGDSDEPERRIRKVEQGGEAKYFYTEKGLGDLCREEEEYEISEYSYKRLRELTITPTIKKRRYYFSLDTLLTAEIDVYGDALAGLITVEVEFPDLESASHFNAPTWFGKEITYDPKYKNKNLAVTLI